VQAVVDAYNDLVSYVDQQSAVTQDTTTDDRSVAAGPLAFDGTVRSILDGLRTAVSSAVSGLGGRFSSLAPTGSPATRDGTRSLDGAALDAALASDENGVAALFAGDGTTAGVFDRVHDYLTGVTGAGGLLDVRTKSISASIDDLLSRIQDGQRQV